MQTKTAEQRRVGTKQEATVALSFLLILNPKPQRHQYNCPPDPAAPMRTRQQNTPVLVMLDRKGRGGKSVSVIKQVMSPAAGKEALLKLIKTKLGTGGTIKDGNIEIQGDHRDTIVGLLKELGYQAKRAGG